MVTIRFRLKDGAPNKDGTRLIVLVMTFDSKRLHSGTKISIKPEYWDDSLKDKRGAITKKHPQALSLNAILDKLANQCITAYNLLRAQDKQCTQEGILELIRQETKSQKRDVIKCLDEFISVQRNLQELTEGRIKHYVTLRAYLVEFSEAYNYKLTFERINADFFEKFKGFMSEIKLIVNNTAAQKIKALKRFMRYARERGWHNATDFEKFGIKEYSTQAFALTSEELHAIEGLNLENEPSLALARDFFLIECYTGLRYSDISRLRQENIRENAIHIRLKKSKEPHRVPLFEESLQLLTKYIGASGQMPQKHNGVINKQIKKLCELAGLIRPESISRMRGNKTITIDKLFSDFITTHTGRRTCITYLHSKSFSVEEISVITQQTPEIVRQYIKLSATALDEKFRTVMTGRFSKANDNND